MINSDKWFVIINPKAGNSKAKKQWPVIKSLLKAHNFSFNFFFTEYKGHSTLLVLQAIKNGFKKIICVGGDGTIHHTINGIMRQKSLASSNVTLGVIPIGTGNDWSKTYNINSNLEQAVQIIKANKTCLQDVGKISFLDTKTPPVYFNNLAGIGFDGLVVKKAQPIKYLGKLTYIIATLKCFLWYKNISVIVKTLAKTYHLNALMIVVGLGKFSGGGMQLTHNPDVKDGLFDVTLVGDLTKWDIIKNIGKLYSGKINEINNINTLKLFELYIKPDIKNRNIYIQADGEIFNAENIKVSLYKKALKLCYNNTTAF